MLSDEEKKAIEHLKNYPINWLIENVNESAIKIILNLIEKKQKEIEELKEKNENLLDALNNSIDIRKYWVSKEVSEQKERKAYIKGTNDAHELCNKKWEDKTKAIIEELENYYRELYKQDNSPNEFLIGQDCLSKLSILQEVKQSLLEKED